jgi:hypothetical protein
MDAPYLARRPWEASGGKPESVIGAMAGVILDLQERYSPEVTYCAWEANGSVGSMLPWERQDAFASRRSIDPEYKSGRSPWPSELVDLISEFIPVLSQMGVTHVYSDDEADDALAALVTHCPSCGGEGIVQPPAWDHGTKCAHCDGSGSPDTPALIWSCDKDLLQLVSPGIAQIRDYRNSDREPITHENIIARTGLSPAGWTAFLALAGDATDGIKHPAGIGSKRAQGIIAAVPNILELLSAHYNCDRTAREIACRAVAQVNAPLMKWCDRLFDQADIAMRALQLVKLRPDSPLHVTPPAKDLEAAAAWFVTKGHTQIARRLEEARAPWDEEEDSRDPPGCGATFEDCDEHDGDCEGCPHAVSEETERP